MLANLLFAAALLVGTVSGAHPSVGQVQNPSFEQYRTVPSAHNYKLPLHWEQYGTGNDTHPTVVLTQDRVHTGEYAALFLPKSVTSMSGVTTYEAEIYQEIDLVEHGQLLVLSWWVSFGEVPAGADPNPFGSYNFTVSYDHDEHESQVVTPILTPGTGTLQHNRFYHYTATWYAPLHHDHEHVYVTLKFTTHQTSIYVYLDDISLTSPYIVGDPQFVGLRGQSYQVHGIDGAIYNLISSPSTQVNAKFDFLSQGECPVFDGVPDTNCYAHPGSYLGSIGIQEIVAGKLHQLAIVAGPSSHGFASVIVDGQTVNEGTSFEDTDAFMVDRVSSHRVTVQTSQFLFTFDNSDMFVNQAIASRVPLSSLRSHGLFGQTHQRKVYASAIKYIAGDVDDYEIEENTLFGKDFVYNQFQA